MLLTFDSYLSRLFTKIGFYSVIGCVHICFVNIIRKIENDLKHKFFGGRNVLPTWECQGTCTFSNISVPLKLENEYHAVVS